MPESFLSDKSLWLNLQLHSDMEKKMLFEIQNDKEVSRIYMELKAGFYAFIHATIPTLSHEECEEIYNDSFMALCENISSGKLQTLTCSLQTYINQIGRNKSVSYLRRKGEDLHLISDYQIGQWDDLPEDENIEADLLEKVYRLVKEMQNDTCRKLLFGFYWHHYTMEMLARLIGANSADVAKTTKNRCLTKLRNAAKALLR